MVADRPSVPKAKFNWLLLVGMLGFVLAILQVGLMDSGPNSALKTTDCLEFYTAGRLVAAGQATQLYDPVSQQNYSQAAYIRYADSLLPSTTGKFDGAFVYPPAVAILMVPLGFLPYRVCLPVWQCLSLIALFVSCSLFKSCASSSEAVQVKQLVVTSFACFYMAELFLVGQTGILLGLLPFGAGYYFCKRERPLPAALALSLTALKPTYLVPAALVVIALAVRAPSRRYAATLFASFAAAVALILLLPMLVFGPTILSAWLHTVKTFAPAAMDAPHPLRHFWYLIGLPATIGFALPASWRAHATSVFSAYALTAAIVEAILLLIFTRRAASMGRKIDIAFFLALVLLPVTSPYLGNADMAALLLACWIYVFQLRGENGRLTAVLFASALLCADACYLLMPLLVTSGIEPVCIVFCSSLIAAAVGSACLAVYRQLRTADDASSKTS